MGAELRPNDRQPAGSLIVRLAIAGFVVAAVVLIAASTRASCSLEIPTSTPDDYYIVPASISVDARR